MVKKILLITFLCLSTSVFSQKTLEKLTTAPNPFSSTTSIQFNTTKNQSVFLVIKNVLGKTVFSKIYKVKIGVNKITFKRNDLQSGIYIYAIRGRNEIISKRLVIK